MRLISAAAAATLAACLLAGPCFLAGPRPARAEEAAKAEGRPARPAIFPLADVRPGMKGYGLTVKAGTKVERFDVEVVDVMRNFLVKQDVILVRCLGEEFADHRIAQGMSGSPIYLDGRCVGALSYTWAWSKHALAGVTPIERMLEEGQRPLEGRPTGAEPPTRLRRDSKAATADGGGMVPIGTPVCLGGFSAEGRAALAEALSPFGLAVQAGGDASGRPAFADPAATMEPGATLVVDLLRGDFSMSALGTCTFVDGERVHGFGHPFNDLGETLMPMSVGYVYTIVSSENLSFKMGASVKSVGAVVQDRPSGVVGVLGREAPMIPVDVRFENLATKRTESFRFEVTANRTFVQPILQAALREAFAKAETTLGLNTKRYTMTLKVKGIEEPWTYSDVITGFDAGMNRVLVGLVDKLMIHPRQRADIEWFKLDVGIEHSDRSAIIETVEADADEVRPGEELTLRVRLRRREGGEALRETMTLRVPDDAPEGTFTVQVSAGDLVSADVGTPVDVVDLPALTKAFYRSTEIIAVVPTGRVDLDMDGRLLRSLPLSSLPRLARAFQGPGLSVRPVTLKVRKDVPYVVDGTDKVSVQVRR